MSKFSQHAEWLKFVEVSGPFVTVEQLDEVFPQGLEAVETSKRKYVRAAYEDWYQSVEEGDPDLEQIHEEWISTALEALLGYREDILAKVEPGDAACTFTDDVSGMSCSPDYLLHGTDGTPFMFISTLPTNAGAQKQPPFPVDEMTRLCRAKGVRLGLITNGEQWMLVHAPVGEMSTTVSWYAHFWFQEPLTLQAFSSLLSRRRFFGPKAKQLPALMDKASEHQQTITDTLGAQVRSAVEVLIQCLDRADADRNRELLRDVSPAHLYEASLTVMMRLVFLLCAEERDLLLLNDPIYDANYAISLLRERLDTMAVQHGAEVLERRYDAWAQIIAVFRAVYYGIEHENLRLPALGGSLFDPDKYPFLEGRRSNAPAGSEPVVSLPIDNRTVLLLLTSLQVVEQSGGALIQSYRALDVEQIGYIYEGLLENTAKKASEPVLGLIGSDKAPIPNVALSKLESLALEDGGKLVKFLKEATGRSESALRRALQTPDDEAHLPFGDSLAARVKPFVRLVRKDAWGHYAVYPEGSFHVTPSSDRRSSGTHYTPKILTERIVKSALEPVVYRGPAEAVPRTDWKLKTPDELLALKVCDPAMGSGAFLVQACRYLADRLVESWDENETKQTPTGDLIPTAPTERLAEARRLVSEKCLYGVDINPLAVELAKLSLWLVTIAKERPFGYLDHNLRAGDSLLGIHDIAQLSEQRLFPKHDKGALLFGRNIGAVIDEALKNRLALRETRILDIHDVEKMAELDRSSHRALEKISCFADLFCGTVLATKGSEKKLQTALDKLDLAAADLLATPTNDSAPLEQGTLFGAPVQANLFSPKNATSVVNYASEANRLLGTDLPSGSRMRRPFHWALEFPEVFAQGGFDAICGNPPFSGGQHLTGSMGTAYRDYLVRHLAEGKKGSADLVAYFYLRAYQLLRPNGIFGLIACNTIAEGDTRQVGLEQMLKKGANIISASPNMPWPGEAAVVISPVALCKGEWKGKRQLNDTEVDYISAFLSAQDEWSPMRLKANANQSFIGSYVLGMGFTMSEEEAQALIDKNPKNAEALFPYLNGEDLNSDPQQKPSRWIINFFDWPLEFCRENYPDLLEIVEEKVRPERESKKDKVAREHWWQFLRPRGELYHAIGRGSSFIKHPEGWSSDRIVSRVLTVTRVSKTLAFSFVKPQMVFSDATVDFSVEDFAFFAVMQSGFHAVWAWQQASKMKTDLRYGPSDTFETFPFPKDEMQAMQTLGETYDTLRREIMTTDNIGLTKLYNAFHDEANGDERLVRMRELQVQIDTAVRDAYGWSDIALGHGFHAVPYLPANDNIRYTISEPARLEILKRLAQLNRERWEEEQKGTQIKK